MHLITQKALKDAAEKYPQHKTELVALGNTIAKGYFKKPESLKAVFPSLDNFKYLDKHYVFNVGGNELRVVAMVFFESQKCYIREVMTHKEYDFFTAVAGCVASGASNNDLNLQRQPCSLGNCPSCVQLHSYIAAAN